MKRKLLISLGLPLLLLGLITALPVKAATTNKCELSYVGDNGETETNQFRSIASLLSYITDNTKTYTIKLLSDLGTINLYNTETNNKNYTFIIDLNGYKVGQIQGGFVVRIGDGMNVTLKNGSIVGNIGNVAKDRQGILLGSNTSLIIEEGLTITLPKYSDLGSTYYQLNKNDVELISIKGSGNTVTINGGTFSGGSYGIAYIGANNKITVNDGNFTSYQGIVGNGSSGDSNNTISIKGGKFDCTSCGMSFPNDDNVTVEKATVNVEKGPGVLVRGGNVTLGEGVNITTTGTGTTTIGDNKINVPSSAVVFDATSGYTGLTADSKITINGGTYTSADGEDAVRALKDDSHTLHYISVTGGTFSKSVADEYNDSEIALQTSGGKVQYQSGDDITIKDGDYTSFSVPTQLTGKTVTYTRTFPNTSWNAWFVPFVVDAANSDVTFYKISNTQTGTYNITVEEVTEGTIEANTPYLVKAKEANKEVTFTATNTTVSATSSAVAKTYGSNYTFTGIYSIKTAATSDETWYALSGGTFYQPNSGASLKPFRFYLDANGAQSPSFSIVVNDDVTGITGTEQSVADLSNTVIYDLQGCRVSNPGKGLYIINGKKVIIK